MENHTINDDIKDRLASKNSSIRELFLTIHAYIEGFGDVPARLSQRYVCYDDRRNRSHEKRRWTVYHTALGKSWMKLYLIRGSYNDPRGKITDCKSYSEIYIRQEEIDEEFIEYVKDLVRQGYEK
jgi:hypothetical protein